MRIRAALVAALTVSVSLPAAAAGAPAPARVAALLRGIPQQGVALGRPTAPVTLVEFADLQCPYCARWARDTFPTIVRRYVRPGKVRIVFAGMTFLGPDSARAFRAALAAGEQHRFWNLAELLYLEQGAENSGWVSDAFLRRAAGTVAGLDVRAMLRARTSPTVDARLAAAAQLVQAAGVDRTPSFAAGPTGKSLRLLDVTSLDARAIEPALDALLRS